MLAGWWKATFVQAGMGAMATLQALAMVQGSPITAALYFIGAAWWFAVAFGVPTEMGLLEMVFYSMAGAAAGFAWTVRTWQAGEALVAVAATMLLLAGVVGAIGAVLERLRSR